MKIYQTKTYDVDTTDELQAHLIINLKEKLIDYIMLYQTTENYTFNHLYAMSLDDLYRIRREIG